MQTAEPTKPFSVRQPEFGINYEAQAASKQCNGD